MSEYHDIAFTLNGSQVRARVEPVCISQDFLASGASPERVWVASTASAAPATL